MKALKLNQGSKHTPYEAEKDLRLFADLTGQALSILLGPLLAEAEEALESDTPMLQTEALKQLVNGLDHALFLIRNLRYFSRSLSDPHHVTDLSQRVLDTIDRLEKDFKKFHIELAAFVEAGLYSRMDPGVLEQILSNLLLNAQSAMPKGGKLTVALGKNGTHLEFCVSDTGQGLSQEQLEHLFEPYYAPHHQAFHSKDRGLGLVVAKALIEAEGGELTVRSTLGKGTNFLFKLPYDPKTDKPEPFLQKRRFNRIHLTLPVQVNFPHMPPFMSRLTTLSVGGCFIPLPPQLPLPSKHTSFSITLLSLGERPLLIENVRVAHTLSTDTGPGMGVEFPKLEKKVYSILSAVVKGYR